MTRLRLDNSGATMPAPEHWEVFADQRAETVLALEPPRPGHGGPWFRASLVLTAVGTSLDFGDWQNNTDLLFPKVLTDYWLLDLERIQVAGRPGGRRLARHVSPDGTDVTMEQWFTLAGGAGVTVTATVDTWRYAEMADDLAAYATGLTVDGQ